VYRIEIDRSLCSGFGICAEIASRSIRIGADGIAGPIQPQTDDPEILEAAAACPMGAIGVYEQSVDQAA
jgi:ferredoxin